MPHESTIQDKICNIPLGIKNSISLALFHPVYFIEIVTIAGRQSLPLSYLGNYKLKNKTLNMLCNILLLDFQMTKFVMPVFFICAWL